MAGVKAAMEKYKAAKKKSPLGEGGRFRAMTAVAKAKGAKNPKALAAWIGRKKLGKSRFQELAAKARRKS